MSNVVNLFGAAKSAAPAPRKRSRQKALALGINFGGTQSTIYFDRDPKIWSAHLVRQEAAFQKQLAAAKRYEGVPPGEILQ